MSPFLKNNNNIWYVNNTLCYQDRNQTEIVLFIKLKKFIFIFLNKI